MENMKEQLMDFIDYCLEKANQYPDYVNVYMHQAYGAMTFYCITIYENEPDVEIEITNYWNNIIHPKFLEIRMKGN